MGHSGPEWPKNMGKKVMEKKNYKNKNK